ncbi:MAG: hypothetical protein LBT83_09280 [Tannerella sp.]|jgi:rhodanese-related sulfurtransferase|nr:hypothetical protein [Tannerella sp.]
MKKIYLLISLSVLGWMTPASAQDDNLSIKAFVEILQAAEYPQILDARSPEEFSQNRIKGAVSADMTDSVGLKKLIGALNPKVPTFTYSINSGRSAVLANRLRASGFERVYVLPGGLANWVGAGYPLEMSGEKGVELTGEQFEQLTRSNDLALVDFGSKYCGGCRRLVPVLDSLETSFSSDLKIVRIELYENPGLVKDQHIESLPTLVLFRKGEKVWTHRGFITAAALSHVIKGHLTP